MLGCLAVSRVERSGCQSVSDSDARSSCIVPTPSTIDSGRLLLMHPISIVASDFDGRRHQRRCGGGSSPTRPWQFSDSVEERRLIGMLGRRRQVNGAFRCAARTLLRSLSGDGGDWRCRPSRAHCLLPTLQTTQECWPTDFGAAKACDPSGGHRLIQMSPARTESGLRDPVV